jgi:transcriptional regulator with XRE-family HTH domain
VDLVLKLRELRRFRGLSQADAARQSGLGVKTLSSFETGDRISSMKLVQLQQLLRIYQVTEAEFFSAAIEHLLARWETNLTGQVDRLVADLRSLPDATQHVITDKLRLAIDLARDLAPKPAPRPHLRLSA